MLIGKLENESVNELRRKVLSLSSLPIYIDDCFSSQLNYLINSMTTINITKGVRLFVVDYLQLISNITRGGTKEQEVAGIARELKNFAKRTDSTVILLSQLSRKQNQRVGSEPKLSDLRDSGQIEEAADIVILTYRPEVYGIGQFDDGTNTDGKAELIIAKGRNIGLARFLLNFDKELTLFSNYNAESTTYNQSNTDPNF
jgi:replicative DNA helicase